MPSNNKNEKTFLAKWNRFLNLLEEDFKKRFSRDCNKTRKNNNNNNDDKKKKSKTVKNNNINNKNKKNKSKKSSKK